MKKAMLTICLVGLFVSVQGCQGYKIVTCNEGFELLNPAQVLERETERLASKAKRQAANEARQAAKDADKVYVAKNSTGKIKEYVAKHMLVIGMNEIEVRASKGSPPNSVNRTVGAWGVHEQWVYGGLMGAGAYKYYITPTYLYFENGVLTAWQN